ncbi:MAG: DUF3747 domain-containing protein [Xenococcaceae cyanobacterium MO_207.B15]|nr:DUF3747 domain-containing protein [Xenococcaceae cyanobacterium MO_207.B15]
MKLSQRLALAVTTTAITSLAPCGITQASSFGEQEVYGEDFVVVATPYRHGYNLMIIEQIPGQRKCWNEIGANPTIVDPLLTNFDFTRACRRSFDSNGYSIRLEGRDLGMDYLTNIVEKNGELHLIGIPRDPSLPKLRIGRTYGLSSGSLKIILNPSWRLTRRTYGRKVTQHIYLSKNSGLANRFISEPPPRSNSVYHKPARTYTAPPVNPVYQQPAKTYTAPPVTSVSQEPPSIYIAPPVNPVYQQLNTDTTLPANPVSQPPSIYTAPPVNPVYQQPNAYTVPQSNTYATPPAYTYTAPPVNPISQPPSIYTAPPVNPVYQQPAKTYTAPSVNTL